MSELVEQLREVLVRIPLTQDRKCVAGAADRIEELERALREMVWIVDATGLSNLTEQARAVLEKKP